MVVWQFLQSKDMEADLYKVLKLLVKKWELIQLLNIIMLVLLLLLMVLLLQ